ncbi:MAG: slipin family protein [Methanocellales archaeon]
MVNGNVIAAIIGLLIFLFILMNSIRIVREYERAVIFRLGRLVGPKGPGIFFIVPIVDRTQIVDLRTVTFDVPKQNIITRDNVTVDVDAVVYYRVFDPAKAVVNVQNYVFATNMLAQTTLRDVLGQVEFDELLTKREDLSKKIQEILDVHTDPWGIKVIAVSIKDVAIPESMQRAIAKQAEAERERRSRIIMAEGERQAAKMMAEAAESYAQSPVALRLRELQTWTEISREKNLIVVTEGTAGASLGAMLGLMREKQK